MDFGDGVVSIVMSSNPTSPLAAARLTSTVAVTLCPSLGLWYGPYASASNAIDNQSHTFYLQPNSCQFRHNYYSIFWLHLRITPEIQTECQWGCLHMTIQPGCLVWLPAYSANALNLFFLSTNYIWWWFNKGKLEASIGREKMGIKINQDSVDFYKRHKYRKWGN